MPLAEAAHPLALATMAANPLDATDTQPMLSRSEGFAEDLFDSHPAH